MGKTIIEYLFSDSVGRQGTREWYKYLREHPTEYANCNVVSLTRVKNLNSDWKHEYIQFIVEEATTKERTRIYAERGNEKDLDWITFGRNEQGNSALKDLPLPLTSLIFGSKTPKSKDTPKFPTVLEIAELLASVTNVGGAYNFYGHCCFWFAYVAYETIKKEPKFFSYEKNWQIIGVGGRGNASAYDGWSLGITTLFKFAFKSKAQKFEIERQQHMVFDANKREFVTQEEVVGEVVKQLLDDDVNMKEYIKAVGALGIDADKPMIESAAAQTKAVAKEKSEGEVKWNEEFDFEVDDFCRTVLSDPATDTNLAAYESARREGAEEPNQKYNGPQMDKYELMQKALNAFVGKMLDGVEKGNEQ